MRRVIRKKEAVRARGRRDNEAKEIIGSTRE